MPTAVREQYLERMGRLLDDYGRELRTSGIDYCLVDTSKPLDFALATYLSTRSRHL